MRKKEKLNQDKGETLTETLVAVLIASLALMMFAGAISSSTRIITKNRETIRNYYASDTSIHTGIVDATSDTIKLTESPFSLLPGDTPISEEFDVSYYSNSIQFGNTTVGMYTLKPIQPETETEEESEEGELGND